MKTKNKRKGTIDFLAFAIVRHFLNLEDVELKYVDLEDVDFEDVELSFALRMIK